VYVTRAQPRQPFALADRTGAGGFTLLELLVVVAIITALLGLVLPSLGAAREKSRVSVCLANAQSINAAMTMYLSEDGRNLPWLYIYAIGEDGEYELYPGTVQFTSFGWGGMQPEFGHETYDCQVTPVDARPFNRFVAPEARRFDILRTYICPSDKNAANPGFSFQQGPTNVGSDEGLPNWREFGMSYSISWYWLRAYNGQRPDVHGLDKRLMTLGPQMLTETRGGVAARLI
jgi:prepilin-type N-terminal cleavage/methylation domain-containing protein